MIHIPMGRVLSISLCIVLLAPVSGCSFKLNTDEKGALQEENVSQTTEEVWSEDSGQDEQADPDQELRDRLTGTWRDENGTLVGFKKEYVYWSGALPEPYSVEPTQTELIVGDEKLSLTQKVFSYALGSKYVGSIRDDEFELIDHISGQREGKLITFKRVSDELDLDTFYSAFNVDSMTSQSIPWGIDDRTNSLSLAFWDGQDVSSASQVIRVSEPNGEAIEGTGKTLPEASIKEYGTYSMKCYAYDTDNAFVDVDFVFLVNGEEPPDQSIIQDESNNRGYIAYPKEDSDIVVFFQFDNYMAIAPVSSVYYFTL